MDEFFSAKFQRVDDARQFDGYRLEVREGWNYARWIEGRCTTKTCSPDIIEWATSAA